MSNIVLHKAATRGHAQHGWLESWQSFSFAGYYNPERIRFGALRVLNDDVVEGGKGFGLHPHDNMEIISIPLEGALEHKDNMGNTVVTEKGSVQIMSTGSGVFHSEYNYNADAPAKFLQIWLYPNQLNVAPRYDKVALDAAKQTNRLQQFIAPQPEAGGTWLYQDAWFSMGTFSKGKETEYKLHNTANGIYVFVISGAFETAGQRLDVRDGMGISGEEHIVLTALENNAEVLVMEVPMEV